MPLGHTILDPASAPLALAGNGGDLLFPCSCSPAVCGYYRLLQEPGYNALLFKDEMEAVRRILQHLPPKQARLCELYFIDDFSYREIARFTNLSPTTVKNHIAWSMIILRNYMAKPKAPV